MSPRAITTPRLKKVSATSSRRGFNPGRIRTRSRSWPTEMAMKPKEQPLAPWREHMHEVIFEADTPAGRGFDIALLVAIGLSVLAVILESVAGIQERFGPVLRTVEWLFTILFTVEYVLRLLSVRRPLRYVFSFFGIVDLLSILPTYLSLFITGAQSLLVIRALRLLRVFRVLKIVRHLNELSALVAAVKATRAKITVFVMVVMILVLIMGSAMYVVEGAESGFTSIPRGIYWAIVTVTTVGYGDIAPRTIIGQIIAAVAMLLGYSLIIIPTGIFSTEMARASAKQVSTQSCPACVREGHDLDASHCKHCGEQL
jgi:voltage-gated potassium channel